MAVHAEERIHNAVLADLRESAGLSQQELADELNRIAWQHGKKVEINRKTVGRWERGEVEWPQGLHRRLLAELLDVSIDELGFRRPRRLLATPTSRSDDLEVLTLVAAPHQLDPRVERDQQQWRKARRELNEQRVALTSAAARLYPAQVRIGHTGLISRPEWIPTQPVELDRIKLAYRPATKPPAMDGAESQSQAVRPLASTEQRYRRYSHAVRDLDHPRLFDNRLSFRLLDLDWQSPSMAFGNTTYFDAFDVCEAMAHETALTHLRLDENDVMAVGQPSWRRLPFRKLLEDPFDLERRPVLVSIATLTIRISRSGAPSFVLHRRDPASVAVAGGMLHVMPAGVFQPSSVMPAAVVDDFDLWRNIMREYSEEFLGNPEHDGDGKPIDYAGTELFAALEHARSTGGGMRVYCLGVAMDALTLYGELLTVAVFEAELYDAIFGAMVNNNSEGSVAAAALPFEEHTVRQLLDRDRLAPAAAGCVELAWQHRRLLLGRH